MSQTAQIEQTSQPTTQSRKRQKTWNKVKAAIEGYMYLAPTLIILAIFVYIPIFTSFRLSLTRIAPFGNKTIFVGIGNYARLFSDPEYLNSLKVTLMFTAIVVPVGI
ncbi:MAG TPA: sugar ABC transporter permease, partial [Chloroflexi bacterium]|nr:sugar ABC transporter permease [Chloroflexota bacterium]